MLSSQQDPKCSCVSETQEQGHGAKPMAGAGVGTRALLGSLRAAVSGSGSSQTAQAVEWEEDTSSGCFCTRSCWYQNCLMFPRLISEPTWVLSRVSLISVRAAHGTFAVHFSAGSKQENTCIKIPEMIQPKARKEFL